MIFDVHIDAQGVPFEVARKVGLQYLSHVDWYNYDGQEITVMDCLGDERRDCKYRVFHVGNGCGWGSLVSENCASGKCIYSFTAYDEGAQICE